MSKTQQWRQFRTKHFLPIGLWLTKKRIKASYLTVASIASGLFAAWHLGSPWYLLAAGLHLLFDGIDGIVARIEGETLHGKYLDYIGDRLVTLALLITLGVLLDDSYPWILAGLFIIVHAIAILTKFQAPAYASRTIMMLLLVFSPLWTLAYLVTGAVIVYSFALQIRWFFTQQHP